MESISVKQAAKQWGLSERRVRLLCQQGKIKGVIQEGRAYRIPVNAVKPSDGRTLRGKVISCEYSALFARIDALKAELAKRRPLTQGELEKLQNEFEIGPVISNIYNKNLGKKFQFDLYIIVEKNSKNYQYYIENSNMSEKQEEQVLDFLEKNKLNVVNNFGQDLLSVFPYNFNFNELNNSKFKK